METSTRCREGVPPQGANHALHRAAPTRSPPVTRSARCAREHDLGGDRAPQAREWGLQKTNGSQWMRAVGVPHR